MSDLDQRFTQAQTDVKGLSEQPDNSTLLQLYSLYKQGTNGEESGKRPGIVNFVGRAKFDAWSELKGTSQDAAKERYVTLVQKLLG